jgi:hypothetical protein
MRYAYSSRRALAVRQWLTSTLLHSVDFFQASDSVQRLLSRRKGLFPKNTFAGEKAPNERKVAETPPAVSSRNVGQKEIVTSRGICQRHSIRLFSKMITLSANHNHRCVPWAKTLLPFSEEKRPRTLCFSRDAFSSRGERLPSHFHPPLSFTQRVYGSPLAFLSKNGAFFSLPAHNRFQLSFSDAVSRPLVCFSRQKGIIFRHARRA